MPLEQARSARTFGVGVTHTAARAALSTASTKDAPSTDYHRVLYNRASFPRSLWSLKGHAAARSRRLDELVAWRSKTSAVGVPVSDLVRQAMGRPRVWIAASADGPAGTDPPKWHVWEHTNCLNQYLKRRRT